MKGVFKKLSRSFNKSLTLMHHENSQTEKNVISL